MRKFILTQVLILSLGFALSAQNFKYELVKDEANPGVMCVLVHAQFTDADACLNGGDVVFLTPQHIELQNAKVTGILGDWSLVSDGGTFDDFHVYQFTSASISKNLAIDEDRSLTLFCIQVEGDQRSVDEIRLLKQVDHMTASNAYPDRELFAAGVQHTTAASFSPNCNPTDGTVFTGIVESSSLGDHDPDIEGKPFEGQGSSVDVNVFNGRSAGEISIYPNPAFEEIHIQLPGVEGKLVSDLEMYDSSGKLVFSNAIDSKAEYANIDLRKANITSGIYLIQLLDGEELVQQEKVIVQRPK